MLSAKLTFFEKILTLYSHKFGGYEFCHLLKLIINTNLFDNYSQYKNLVWRSFFRKMNYFIYYLLGQTARELKGQRNAQ